MGSELDDFGGGQHNSRSTTATGLSGQERRWQMVSVASHEHDADGDVSLV